MKKNGFTLAEVLITLAIIGVVATLTLPALMTNTAEQQAKTAFKKGINTLTEAAQMNQAIDGFDYASFSSTDTVEETQSLYGLLDSRTSIDYQKSGSTGDTNKSDAKLVDSGSTNYVVFFRDGSALSYNPANTLRTNNIVSALQADGLVYGIPAVYDTNGAKGPNQLSNCDQNASLIIGNANTTEAVAKDDATNAKCKVKGNRVIKDQFGVRLRGGYAVPNGPAARWAFEN